MDHKHLLKELGGEHAVHAALAAKGIQITPTAVRAWALGPRAIPAKYWVAIKEVADERGVPCSFEALAKSVNATDRTADAA